MRTRLSRSFRKSKYDAQMQHFVSVDPQIRTERAHQTNSSVKQSEAYPEPVVHERTVIRIDRQRARDLKIASIHKIGITVGTGTRVEQEGLGEILRIVLVKR